MAITLEQLGLCWDPSAVCELDDSQQWLLKAMHKHGDSLVTMLWRILGNESDVCDAYQQTFLNIAHIEHCRKPENVHAYLFSTATNIALSMLRRRQLKAVAQTKLSAITPDCVEPDACELDSAYMQECLRSAIAMLPEHMREVVVLKDLAEFSYREISKILGIPASNARAYRSKAITLLAKLMASKKEQVLDE